MNGGGGTISREERRRLSRSENDEAIAQEDKDVKIFEDEISKLRELNRQLVEEINRTREENESLSKTFMENKRPFLQCRADVNELDSELKDFMAKTKELDEKTEEDRRLWEAEKRSLEGSLAEMETNLEMVVTESELLTQKNRDLSTEMEFLKAQLNECNAKLAFRENESDQNKRSLHQCRTEKIDLESELNESRGKSQELHRKFEEGCLLWQAEKSNLQCIVEELLTKLDMMDSERGLLSKNNTELGTEAESLKAQLNECTAKLACMENERDQTEMALHQCRTEKIDLESELNESKEISQDLYRKFKEDYFLLQSEKNNLECTVEGLLLTNLDMMDSEKGLLSKNNTELGTEAESLKAQLNECNTKLACTENERDQTEMALHQCRTEKIDLESELNESKERSQDLYRKSEEDYFLWQFEKNILECTVQELLTNLDMMDSEKGLLIKNNTELGTEAESLKAQLNELESEFMQSKACSQKLLGTLEENWHLWDTENKTLKDITAKLQTELELMASESASLSQRNNELSSELDSTKAQLMEYNVSFVCMDDEKQMLNAVSSSNAKRLEALITENATKEKKINCLQQVNEAIKLDSDLTQQYELSEDSLKQQNEKLQEELDIVKCLHEAQKRIEESNVENGRSNKLAEELSKTLCGDLWDWPQFMLKLVIVRPFQIVRWMILLPFAFVSLVLEICIFLIFKFSKLFFKWVT